MIYENNIENWRGMKGQKILFKLKIANSMRK